MINGFHCINISTKQPEGLVKFYNEKLNVPIIEFDENYDGVSLGFIKDAPVIVIWDENKWGKSNEGTVNLVFRCDNIDKTYLELKEKGVLVDPPQIASWGGKELPLKDIDGNKVLILE
ncbi:VOC family protein [Fusibacter ferrireducens]|uniref:VOC family protein n=1 Tax=Fusibacter ferrireducens TaxID=2785058 RepID=A0ABR9ZM46_9FIRM|nr:VOC family protein [Fusibacter ferrireducens]MBF4691499.1 VOC family protein [Fusibacter ferrireducens]